MAGLLLVAAFFRFYHLERADMINDASTYAFRSIGYTDILMSDIQTTPLKWFGYAPSWSKLSFHDAPPLVFLIQHCFFNILGVNLTTARLPFVIFGILTVLVFYFFAKELYGRKTAFLASLFLAVDAYHTLSSQSGLLEPILLFFVILGLWFFKKGLADSKYLILAGLFFGLSLLCKYLALFLPLFFLFVVFSDKKYRRIFRQKNFYLALIVFLIVVSPLLVYNYQMHQTRGHFDMQLALLLGQKQQDWTSISGRQIGASINQNFFGFFEAVKNSSVIVYWLFLIGLFYILISPVRKSGVLNPTAFFKKEAPRKKPEVLWNWLFNGVKIIFYREKKHLFLGLILMSLLAFFGLVGSSARYLAILPPFVFLVAAVFLMDLAKEFRKIKYCIFTLIGVLIIYLAVFNFNSNQFAPIGKVNLAYSAYREDNWGYNQLEKYWTAKYPGIYQLPPVKIKKIDDTELGKNMPQIPELFRNNLLVYDGKMNWFAKEWYIYRWLVYWRAPFVSTDEFTELASREGGIEFLNSLSGKNLIFIKATEKSFLDPGENNVSVSAEFIEKRLLEQNFKPIDVIYNPKGEEAFRIYKIPQLIKKN